MPDEYYNSIYEGEEIDRRLGLAGEVADAVIFDANSSSLWAVGAISSSTGANSTSTTRLRTTGYLGKGVQKISIDTGYKYILFGYNNGTYMGTWNGTSFVKSGNWRTTETDLTALPAYDFRLVMAYSGDGTITTDAATHLTMTSTTDSSLTLGGRAPDSAVVGDMLRTAIALTTADMRVTTIPSGTDYDTLTEPGNYRVINAAGATSMINCPVSVGHRLTVEFIYGSVATKQTIQTPTATLWRVLSSGAWGVWQSVRSYTTAISYLGDRTANIYKRLTQNGLCELGSGTFQIAGLDMPPNTRLVGSGRRTILQVDSAATGYAIKMNYGCVIENVKIIGPQGEDWTPDGTETARHGIVINTEGETTTNRNRQTIHNVEITGFDGAGIYMISTGYNYDNSVNVSDCYIHHNNYGIDNPKRSEYNRICNCSIANNFVGIRMNGGNNLVSNCGINGNVTGLVMDATEVSGASNNSHGTFVACNFNHNSDGQGNVTTAIRINGMLSGEVFSACQIAYGGVTVAGSLGIHFADCNFLSNTPIEVTGTGLTLFSDCIFAAAADSPITGGGNAVLTNCYYRSGTPRT